MRVVVYIAVVATASVLLAWWVLASPGLPVFWGPAAALFAAGIIGWFLHVDMPLAATLRRHHNDKLRFTLSDALLSAGLLLTSMSTVLVASAAANVVVSTIEAVRERQGFVKPFFNASQHLLSLSIALLVAQQLLGEYRPLNLPTLIGIGGVVLVFTMANALAVTGIVSMSTGSPWLGAVRRMGAQALLIPAQTLALGVLAAVVWRTAPVAMVALAIPVLLLHSATQQRVRARLEQERTQQYVEIEQDLGRVRHPAQIGPLIRDAAEQLLERRAAAWTGDRWIGDVPGGSQACRVDAALTDPLVTEGPSLGPNIEGQCAAIGLGDAVLVVWGDDGRLSAETVEWLERLGRSGRVHTARATALMELEREQATLRAVVDGTADGIAVTTFDGVVQVWNPAMAALSGVDHDHAMGRHIGDVLGAGPWTDNGVHQVGYEPSEHVWRVAIATTTQDDTEQLRVAVVHDVTEEHRLARMKNDMLSIVSHELRTPLTPIKASAELLRRRWQRLGEEHREEMLGQISAGATHLTRLVNDLLLVAQMSASDGTGGIQFEPMPTDVAQVVRDSAKQVQMSYPDRQITADIPEHAYGETDPTRFRQIVDNLVDNACKFSPPGELVELALQVDDGEIHLTVQDHGGGIAPEDQERIFERFERVEDPMFMRTSGAGLGLYIVQRLVTNMGGTISLDSAPGAGTTFDVRLPTPETAPSADVPAAAP